MDRSRKWWVTCDRWAWSPAFGKEHFHLPSSNSCWYQADKESRRLRLWQSTTTTPFICINNNNRNFIQYALQQPYWHLQSSNLAVAQRTLVMQFACDAVRIQSSRSTATVSSPHTVTLVHGRVLYNSPVNTLWILNHALNRTILSMCIQKHKSTPATSAVGSL